ncbi:hypothetical protein L1887_46036 [Cichorium endivia]|nr:hypothetical protein L1887_46036 [Cichorium endivia]
MLSLVRPSLKRLLLSRTFPSPPSSSASAASLVVSFLAVVVCRPPYPSPLIPGPAPSPLTGLLLPSQENQQQRYVVYI